MKESMSWWTTMYALSIVAFVVPFYAVNGAVLAHRVQQAQQRIPTNERK